MAARFFAQAYNDRYIPQTFAISHHGSALRKIFLAAEYPMKKFHLTSAALALRDLWRRGMRTNLAISGARSARRNRATTSDSQSRNKDVFAIEAGSMRLANPANDNKVSRFRALSDLAFELAAVLEPPMDFRNNVEVGNTVLRSVGGLLDEQVIDQQRIDDMSEVELCALTLAEVMSAFRDISRQHTDLLPAELLEDLQQATNKIVQRLSDGPTAEPATRFHVLSG
jgi:hypothetical protein